MIEDHKSRSEMSRPASGSDGVGPPSTPPRNEGTDPRSKSKDMSLVDKLEVVCGVCWPFSDKDETVDAC